MVTPGSSILLPPTCSTPAGLDQDLANESERLAGSRVWSGLLLGDYPFVGAPHRDRLRYGTWHVAQRIAAAAAAGSLDSYPIRASHVIEFIRRVGADDVVIVQVAPPDKNGYCSLGVSGSYLHAAARSARVLIMHVNPQVPRAAGPCRLALAQADILVTHEQELLEYPSAVPDETSKQIAARIEPLIPDGATLQIGFGSVPEAVLQDLQRSGRRDLTIWGMATDGVVALAESGMLRDGADPAVYTHEVMGTRRIFDWIDENPSVRLLDYDYCTSVAEIGHRPSFVSINSAIEIDLEGSANAEVLGGRQISGVGGGPDFADGARRSPGGVSIVALPATARRGEVSRIVPKLQGAPHSLPRTTVQYVVTEHGAVDLSVMSLEARAEAMIGLAAPEFRNDLWEEYQTTRRHTT